MTNDDPFFQPPDAGATVIRPRPGARRDAGLPPSPPPPPAAPWPPAPAPAAVMPTSVVATDNPLVACASDLLSVAGELRGSVSHRDPDGLRERLVRQVREFETCARGRGLLETVVAPARYVLCALLDEAILDTPWGSQSIWATKGLLVSFHNETWGGEKFFDALERLLTYPAGNLHLLELMYLCLSQGFEGRYRRLQGGRDQLERVRANLYQSIRTQRGDPERELSPHWRGVAPHRDPLIQQVPLWVLSAVAALLLLGLFTVYLFALSRDSDPVYLSLAGLERSLPAPTDRPRTAPPPVASVAEPGSGPAPLTLRILLADDISAGRLAVDDRPLGQTVIIRGEGLFGSAQATLIPSVEPLIERIGAALARLPGPVLVTGHTDSSPIRSLRFPSNFELSQARANEVAGRLAAIAKDPARFTAEGRADSEPAVPDNPRDARNRRVEITLQPPEPQSMRDAAGARR
ncbi:type IVB secretion system protein IcmH/DotU [uncultured Thiodictyon sp.]|uniref:type IVB secretion system protein IcmH/DotU n=1 Tax=uncultured Thiodictyon sp. TaxID=1846217 RepID=UPI0025F8BFB4|nr:type IVB secretion system protein IcmH/DotU [uncultured Thiodictyon sp.]